jgi:L-asparaginase II
VIAKVGAEGVYSAVLPSLDLGIALKVHDGDMGAVGVALMAVIEATVGRFGGNEHWPFDALGEWRAPAIRNTRGVTTGHLEARGGLHWQ